MPWVWSTLQITCPAAIKFRQLACHLFQDPKMNLQTSTAFTRTPEWVSRWPRNEMGAIVRKVAGVMTAESPTRWQAPWWHNSLWPISICYLVWLERSMESQKYWTGETRNHPVPGAVLWASLDGGQMKSNPNPDRWALRRECIEILLACLQKWNGNWRNPTLKHTFHVGVFLR